MKELLLPALLLLVFALNGQQLEVEGKMLVKDINTIATFRSSVKNSFIRLEINNNPSLGTSIGYFLDTFDGAAETFYIDTPREGFGEFLISEGLVFIRDGLHVDGEGVVATATTGSGHGVLGLGFVSGVAGVSQNTGVIGSGQICDFSAEGTGANYCSNSSRRWKSNILNITDPLQKLSQLRGVYFDWDEEHGGHHDLGFIAEEVGLVLPEIVVYEQNGIDAIGLDYSKLTPLLVEATNALQQQYQERFDQQQNQINELKDQISELSGLKKEMSELRTLLRAELAN